MLWKIIFLSLEDVENTMEKNIKENANENIIIFSLLLSLKNNWENRREIVGKSWEKFYRARYIIFIKSLVRITSLSITMASHHHWPFQRPPPSLWSPPSASNNLPSLSTWVPMDEMCSSNQVPMDEMHSSNLVNVLASMSLDQVWIVETLVCWNLWPLFGFIFHGGFKVHREVRLSLVLFQCSFFKKSSYRF